MLTFVKLMTDAKLMTEVTYNRFSGLAHPRYYFEKKMWPIVSCKYTKSMKNKRKKRN